MINSILATSYPGDKHDETRFEVFGDEAASLEAAEKEVAERAADEKLVTFIPLNQNEPGVRAIAAILDLAIEAANAAPTKFIGSRPAAEGLLLELFMAGVNQGLKMADPFKYGPP